MKTVVLFLICFNAYAGVDYKEKKSYTQKEVYHSIADWLEVEQFPDLEMVTAIIRDECGGRWEVPEGGAFEAARNFKSMYVYDVAKVAYYYRCKE